MRRQTVADEPQPNSLAGRSYHGVEVRAIKTIAAKQLRSATVHRRPHKAGEVETVGAGQPTARAGPRRVPRQGTWSWPWTLSCLPTGAKWRL